MFSSARQRLTTVHQSIGGVAPHGSMYAETRISTSAPLQRQLADRLGEEPVVADRAAEPPISVSATGNSGSA